MRREYGSAPSRDHPRVCGEKEILHHTRIARSGSPPRVRGKDIAIRKVANYDRITPACAGKSPCGCTAAIRSGDHPRVCGEKADQVVRGGGVKGSPPRVRGKECGLRLHAFQTGITPACAGKRKRQRLAPLVAEGSPPRVRGKVHLRRVRRRYIRITPACAGKSDALRIVMAENRDHPRVCGEKTKESLKK